MKYYKKINGRKYHYNEGEIIKGDVLEILFVNDSNYMNDWQEVTEEDYLLQEAKKRYPKGTKFLSIIDCMIYPSSGGFYWVFHTGDNCKSLYNAIGGTVYENGKWAEIIEPKKEPKRFTSFGMVEPKKENMEELKINKEKEIEQMHKNLFLHIYCLDVSMQEKHTLANKVREAIEKTTEFYTTELIKQ